MAEENRKLAIICSKGSLDMAYPGLVLANSALSYGIDVVMFFTFWGLDMVTKSKMNELKISPVGNTSMGMPNALAVIPGVTGMATSMMKGKIAKLDIPPVGEFMDMIVDAGAKLYGCKMSVDMMDLTKDKLYDGVIDIVSAGDFMDMSEGAQIIFI